MSTAPRRQRGQGGCERWREAALLLTDVCYMTAGAASLQQQPSRGTWHGAQLQGRVKTEKILCPEAGDTGATKKGMSASHNKGARAEPESRR